MLSNEIKFITDGGWSGWSAYYACSVTCGGGTQTRQRYCNNPAPLNGGSECQGQDVVFRTCNTHSCPVGKEQ